MTTAYTRSIQHTEWPLAYHSLNTWTGQAMHLPPPCTTTNAVTGHKVFFASTDVVYPPDPLIFWAKGLAARLALMQSRLLTWLCNECT